MQCLPDPDKKHSFCQSIKWLLVAILLPVCSSADSWQTIGREIQISRIQINPQEYFSPELLFIRFPLNSYRVAVVRSREFEKPRMTALAAGRTSKALIAINANFFDETGKALGLVVSQGIKYQDIHRGGKTLTGILSVSRQLTQIVHRDNHDPTGTVEAIQAGPRLVSGGTLVQGIRSNTAYSRRAGVCLAKDNSMILFISSGLIGLTISQLQDVLVRPEIGCLEALNLDGGGSAQLYLSGDLPDARPGWQEIFIHGRDPAPTFLGVFENNKIN